MKRGSKVGEQEKILLITILSLLVIVAVVILLGKSNDLKGAATLDVSSPIYQLNMDSASLSGNKVIKSEGVYETDRYMGKMNNAWKFDGRDDYVITSSNHLQGLNEFTIMFWADPEDLSLKRRAHLLWQGEFEKNSVTKNTGNGWGPEQELHLSLGDELGVQKYKDHQLIFYLGDRKNSLKLAAPLTITGWHHFAVTVKSTDWRTTAELFMDGISVSKGKIDRKIDRSRWNSMLRLGAAGTYGPAGDSNRNYGGLLDEFTLYNRMLTAKEIADTCRTQNDGNWC